MLERWSLAADELSQWVLYIGILPLHVHQPNLYPGSENQVLNDINCSNINNWLFT